MTNESGKRRSESYRRKLQRKQEKKSGARFRRFYHLHPELAPRGFALNWNRLSHARQLRISQSVS